MLVPAVRKEEVLEMLESISTLLDTLENTLKRKGSEFHSDYQHQQEMRIEKCSVLLDGLENVISSYEVNGEEINVENNKTTALQLKLSY